MKFLNNSIFPMTRFSILVGIFVGVIYLSFIAFMYREFFSQPVDLIAMQREFSFSKYILGEQGNEISDDVVYIVAGKAYLDGTLPTEINFEHPPFAKYVFGWFTDRLKNPLFGSFAFFGVFIGAVIWLGLQHLQHWSSRALFWFLIFANPLFYEYSVKAMLDLPQIAFMLLAVVSSQRMFTQNSRIWLILSSLFFGISLSVKYPFPLTVALVVGTYLFIAVHSKKYLRALVAAGLSFGWYLLFYLPLFISGWSLIDFLKFEWWRLQWFLGKVSEHKGLLLQVVLLGSFESPWDDGVRLTLEKYSVLWPISFIGFLISFLWESISKRMKSDTLLIWKFWTIGAFGVYLLGASHDIYLVGLMPGFAFFFVRSFESVWGRVDQFLYRRLKQQ